MSEEVTLDGKLLKELRVPELKAACKVKNLPHSGNKAALIKRLKAALELEDLQKAARNSPSSSALPNSEIAEDSSDNDFIKQYMENQRKLLLSQQHRFSSASESEEEASQQKSPAITSPLAQRTRSLTSQSTEEKSFESDAIVENESSITLQATVTSAREDSSIEIPPETENNLSKQEKDSEKDVSAEREGQVTEKSQEPDQLTQQQEESNVNGVESLISENVPVDSDVSSTIEATTDSGVSSANNLSSALVDADSQDVSLPSQNTLEFTTTESQNSNAKEGSGREEIEGNVEPTKAKDEQIPEQERKSEDSGTAESQPCVEKCIKDVQQEKELQPTEEKRTADAQPESELQPTEERSTEDARLKTELEPAAAIDPTKGDSITEQPPATEEETVYEKAVAAHPEVADKEETLMDVDQMVNQEEELDYDENDAVAQNEKSETMRSNKESTKDGESEPKARRLRVRQKKERKERKRSRSSSKSEAVYKASNKETEEVVSIDVDVPEEPSQDNVADSQMEKPVEKEEHVSRKRRKSSIDKASFQEKSLDTPPSERKARKRLKRPSVEFTHAQETAEQETDGGMKGDEKPKSTTSDAEKITEPKDVEDENEKLDEPKPQKVTRKISLRSRKSEDKSEMQKSRKRKWGSGKLAAGTDTVRISSDLIKDLIDVKPEEIKKAMDDPSVLMEEEPGELVEEEEVDEVGAIGVSEEDHPAASSTSDVDRVTKHPQKVKDGEEDGEIVEEEILEEEVMEAESGGEDADGQITQHDNRKVVPKASKSGTAVRRTVSRSETKKSKGSESKSVNRKDPKAKKAAAIVTSNDPVIDKNRMVSPSRFPVSKNVHVRNLVRPFTVNQLKALLSKTGAIVEDSFWIDKIKSHCLVSYLSEEEANSARNALHGLVWPSSNPKRLVIDFASAREVERIRGPAPDSAQPAVPKETREERKTEESGGERGKERSRDRRRSENEDVKQIRGRPEDDVHNSKRESSPKQRRNQDLREDRARRPDGRSKGVQEEERGSRRDQRDRRIKEEQVPLREWDRDKLDQEKEARRQQRERRVSPRSSDRARRREESRRAKKEEAKAQEQPAKLLDDLFRKTTTAPCIYWLPLTDEQIVQREKEREERRQARAKIRREMEEEEAKNKSKQEAASQGSRMVGREGRTPERRDGNRGRRDSTGDRRPDRLRSPGRMRQHNDGRGKSDAQRRKSSPTTAPRRRQKEDSTDSSSSSSSEDSDSGSDSDSDSEKSSGSPSPQKKQMQANLV